MELVYVDSSNVEQIGYDADWSEVHVIFKTGRHYIYSNVPPDVWDAFLSAPSKGIFLNTVIKKGGYPYREE
jgi:hypothetical protein